MLTKSLLAVNALLLLIVAYACHLL